MGIWIARCMAARSRMILEQQNVRRLSGFNSQWRCRFRRAISVKIKRFPRPEQRRPFPFEASGCTKADEGIRGTSLNRNYRVAALELSPLLALMRFLSLRLKPKAAAAPRAGRGPGQVLASIGPKLHHYLLGHKRRENHRPLEERSMIEYLMMRERGPQNRGLSKISGAKCCYRLVCQAMSPRRGQGLWRVVDYSTKASLPHWLAARICQCC